MWHKATLEEVWNRSGNRLFGWRKAKLSAENTPPQQQQRGKNSLHGSHITAHPLRQHCSLTLATTNASTAFGFLCVTILVGKKKKRLGENPAAKRNYPLGVWRFVNALKWLLRWHLGENGSNSTYQTANELLRLTNCISLAYENIQPAAAFDLTFIVSLNRRFQGRSEGNSSQSKYMHAVNRAALVDTHCNYFRPF